MNLPRETITAAATWASGHGCHNIGSCSATPLEAFIAGAAAERDRIRRLAEQTYATCTVADSINTSRLFADLLRDDRP